MPMHVLIVEADSEFREHLAQRLAGESVEVVSTGDPSEAFGLAMGQDFGAILLGLSGLREGALVFLDKLHRSRPESRVILVNRSGDVSLSIQAMKLGAVDEISIPVDMQALMGLLRAQENGTPGTKTR